MTISSGIRNVYTYVKNELVQVKLRSYRTIQQIFTSKAKIDNMVSQIRTMMPTVWTLKNISNQNKKLIAINNNNKSGRRGAHVLDSTIINGEKSYLLVKVGEWIFKTTQRRYIRGGHLDK